MQSPRQFKTIKSGNRHRIGEYYNTEMQKNEHLWSCNPTNIYSSLGYPMTTHWLYHFINDIYLSIHPSKAPHLTFAFVNHSNYLCIFFNLDLFTHFPTEASSKTMYSWFWSCSRPWHWCHLLRPCGHKNLMNSFCLLIDKTKQGMPLSHWPVLHTCTSSKCVWMHKW